MRCGSVAVLVFERAGVRADRACSSRSIYARAHRGRTGGRTRSAPRPSARRSSSSGSRGSCCTARRCAGSGSTGIRVHERPPPTIGGGILASWCGMRASSRWPRRWRCPRSAPRDRRTPIVFAAFCVVLTTLVFQGLTLRPLMQLLGLHDERHGGPRDRDRAGPKRHAPPLRALDGQPSAGVLRDEYQARLQAQESPASAKPTTPRSGGSLAELQRRAVAARRDALTDLRARQVIGDDAFHVLEEEIDLLELTADALVRPTASRGRARECTAVKSLLPLWAAVLGTPMTPPSSPAGDADAEMSARGRPLPRCPPARPAQAGAARARDTGARELALHPALPTGLPFKSMSPEQRRLAERWSQQA